jgi:flagellar basal-body rod protein FlgC
VFEARSIDRFGDTLDRQLAEVHVSRIDVSKTEGRWVQDAGHPDADERGMVLKPDIDVLHEMVDLMTASRAYEANATVIDATKAIADRALEIGR